VNYAIRIAANDTLKLEIAELLRRPVGRPSHKPGVSNKSFLHQAASWGRAAAFVRALEERTQRRLTPAPRGRPRKIAAAAPALTLNLPTSTLRNAA
jgi:hypothetical protein